MIDGYETGSGMASCLPVFTDLVLAKGDDPEKGDLLILKEPRALGQGAKSAVHSITLRLVVELVIDSHADVESLAQNARARASRSG